MTAYRFTQRYRSSYGAGDEGDVVDLTDEHAADINRDSPGTLVPVETEERAVEKPPANRQVTGAKNRGQKE